MEHIAKFTSRLSGIQSLRGLALLCVLFVHLYETERKYTLGPRLLDNWAHTFMVGVDLFLVISGLVLTLLAFGHFNDRDYLRRYAYARVTRVYPIYLLYTLAVVPVYLMMPGMVNASEGGQVNLLRSLLMLPDVNLPLIPVAWTLHHEAYFYIVFGLMLMLPQRALPKAMLCWLMVSLVLIAMGTQIPRPEQGGFEKVLFNPINLEFLLGMALALVIGRGYHKHGASAIALGVAWLLIAQVWFYSTHGVHWISDPWRIPALGLPAALITYGFVVLELGQGKVIARWAISLGDAAYSIYLTHLLTMALIGKIWQRIGIEGWPAHLLFLVVTAGISLAVGVMAYRLIERPTIQWFRRLEQTRRVPSVKQAT